jgi:plastocyanin
MMLKFSCFLLLFTALAAQAADEPAKKVLPQNVGGVAEAKDSGTISGVVLFKGEKPQVKPIADVAGNAFCKEHHKDGPPPKDTFVFGKNGEKDTVQNVLVYVSKGFPEDKEFEPTKAPVLLDQVGCMYTPHVVAVMVGQTLKVRNSDATLHNVMSTPRDNEPFNFGQSVAGQTNPLTFKEPEMKVNTKCFMHPWMSAYVHVLANPYFAVTGEDGTFKIEGLPPGEYEISVLHEASLIQPTPATATVKVAGGEEKKDVTFTYEVKKED